MTVKRKKARSAPLLVIYAVDKATIKQLEGAIFRIAKSKMEWELKRDAIKALEVEKIHAALAFPPGSPQFLTAIMVAIGIDAWRRHDAEMELEK